jgi:phosphate transport system substrate-binding protein
MRKYLNLFVLIAITFIIVKCNKKKEPETLLEGNTTVLVDETLTPIVEDQVQIFESVYKAKIKLESKSESEVIQAFVNAGSGIAILSRKLTDEENKVFANKKIVPKTTPFAKDAIALISNKSNKDTLIALNDIVDFLKGKKVNTIKGLVFDNPNSSTVRYFCELAGLKKLPENSIFSFKTNNEVIQYIAQNNGMIGVIGINYIFEPSSSMRDIVAKINVLDVKNINDNNYYGPTQNNIAEGKYPLARDLYIINCQGFPGLGMGLTSFIIGDKGQRIVLKSGLVPVQVPPRTIRIRNKINNDKK